MVCAHSIVALAGLALVASVHAQVVFTADELSAATSTLVTRQWRGGGQATLLDQPGGGNPREYLQIQLQVNDNPSGGVEPPAGSIITAFIFPAGAVYTPTVSGAIDRIEQNEDLLFISSSTPTTSGQSRALALRQNGKLYVGTLRTTGTLAAWTTTPIVTQRASNFAELVSSATEFALNNASNPDFSATGAPIELGLYRSIATAGTPGAAGFTVNVGVDTWRASVFNITTPACYPNCDGSTAAPILNALDFGCFLARYRAGESYGNCDGSTAEPVLNALDFGCFLSRYVQGCP